MRLFTAILASVLAFAISAKLNAAPTAFTYQGRLAEVGIPASGQFDFRFTLLDTETNGMIIGGPLTNIAVSVSDGLFTASLDFGAAPFSGTDPWLEIAVRTNGAQGFTSLWPRQHVTPAPLALSAPPPIYTNLTDDMKILWTLFLSAAVTNAAVPSGPPLPSLYATNRSAAALRAALGGVLTNGAPINAMVLTNVSALGLQLGTLQSGTSGANDTELTGNNGTTIFGPAGGFAWVNPKTITATNLVLNVGGKSCPTNAIVEIFQSSSYPTNSYFLNAYSSTPLAPLYSNTVTLPYPKAKLNVPLPNIAISAGQFTFVVLAGPTTNTGAFYMSVWINEGGNTNNPRYNIFYCDATGNLKAWVTTPPGYGDVASPACRFEGFISASSGATAASDLSASTTVSRLAGATAQSQLDQLGTNMTRRLFIFDGDSLSSFDGGGLDWAHRWLTNYPYFAQAKRVSVGTSGYRSWWVWTNYSTLVHPYARTNAADEVYYSCRIGINDVTYGTNLLDTINNVSNLWTSATNDGMRVIAWTLTPVGFYSAATDANRLAFNDWVRNNYFKWGAILMEPDLKFPNANDSSYFYDQVHPTTNAMVELCRQFDETVRGGSGLSHSVVQTNGNAIFVGSGSLSPLVLGNGVTCLPTNSTAFWPAASPTPGGCAIVNSNATVYILTSTPNSTAWAATNKLAGP